MHPFPLLCRLILIVQFSPRQGEPSDEVRIRGEPSLVAKLKAELEQRVATLRDRVVLAGGHPLWLSTACSSAAVDKISMKSNRSLT